MTVVVIILFLLCLVFWFTYKCMYVGKERKLDSFNSALHSHLLPVIQEHNKHTYQQTQYKHTHCCSSSEKRCTFLKHIVEPQKHVKNHYIQYTYFEQWKRKPDDVPYVHLMIGKNGNLMLPTITQKTQWKTNKPYFDINLQQCLFLLDDSGTSL